MAKQLQYLPMNFTTSTTQSLSLSTPFVSKMSGIWRCIVITFASISINYRKALMSIKLAGRRSKSSRPPTNTQCSAFHRHEQTVEKVKQPTIYFATMSQCCRHLESTAAVISDLAYTANYQNHSKQAIHHYGVRKHIHLLKHSDNHSSPIMSLRLP